MKNLLINWKTSATGALMIVTGVAGLVGVTVDGQTHLDPSSAIAMIVAGAGLILAKDA